MRSRLLGLAVLLLLTQQAVAGPSLKLVDNKLPLWELRPLDRHVWVLTLDGTWSGLPEPGVTYTVVVKFPDGGTYAHRPLDISLFRDGEVRVLLYEYQLVRHGVAKGGMI